MPPRAGILSKKPSDDDLHYNAFADPEQQRPRAISSSSNVLASSSTSTPRKRRNTIRRSGSDQAPLPLPPHPPNPRPGWRPEHGRSQTWSDSDAHAHPLGNPSPSPGGDDWEWGVTRPQLSRLLSAWDSPADSESDRGSSASAFAETSAGGGEEKTVLVHEVSSGDSLAGVALKYGISVAALRKANQLWAADSIHLRKVLYIPIRDPPPPPLQNETPSDIDGTGSSGSDSQGQISLDSSHDRPTMPTIPTMLTIPTMPMPTIRRIPASQLSFFPPASKSALYAPRDPREDTQHPAAAPIPAQRAGPPPTSAGGSPGHPARALASLLTALPMSPATRDTLIARLSFDSERASSASDEQDLELDEVRGARAHVRAASSPAHGGPQLHSRAHSESESQHPHPHLAPRSPRATKAPTQPPHPHPHPVPPRPRQPSDSARSISPATPRAQHKSWGQPASALDVLDVPVLVPVRTVQLEPSPVMRVPSVPASAKAKAKTRPNGDPVGGWGLGARG